jgi:hypothetical protein
MSGPAHEPSKLRCEPRRGPSRALDRKVRGATYDYTERGFMMTIYKVQLISSEQLDGAQQRVDAREEEEAAENLNGRTFKQGPSSGIHAAAIVCRQSNIIYER